VARVGAAAAAVIDQRVAADLAEPRVQRRFAPVGIEPLDRLAEGQLHYLARRIVVTAHPNQDEPVQARKETVEQPPERLFVPAQDLSRQGKVDVDRTARFRHLHSPAPVRPLARHRPNSFHNG
jgi:hypothetical protein